MDVVLRRGREGGDELPTRGTPLGLSSMGYFLQHLWPVIHHRTSLELNELRPVTRRGRRPRHLRAFVGGFCHDTSAMGGYAGTRTGVCGCNKSAIVRGDREPRRFIWSQWNMEAHPRKHSLLNRTKLEHNSWQKSHFKGWKMNLGMCCVDGLRGEGILDACISQEFSNIQ